MEEINESENLSYDEQFEEQECIGRGSFGSAFLVKGKKAGLQGKLFIAKKIQQTQLSPKE